jgi:hypothetical protein
MKKRYIYGLLFGIPGFFISLIISAGVFGFAAGILWLYVFGDNPWPAGTSRTLGASFVLTSAPKKDMPGVACRPGTLAIEVAAVMMLPAMKP